MMRFKKYFNEIKQYPSAIIGSIMIAILVLTAIITVIVIPYEDAVRYWQGGEILAENPRNAQPVWQDWFTSQDLTRNQVLDTRDNSDYKTTTDLNGVREFEIELPIDYQYDTFPRELNLFLSTDYEETRPRATVEWITPDGREFELDSFSVSGDHNLRINQLSDLRRELDGESPRVGLLADPDAEGLTPLRGEHKIRVTGHIFEEEASLNARSVVYGQVFGAAGTDHRRRDLGFGLLWGIPVALVFGVLAAVVTTVVPLIIAAIGVWYGGKVDAMIQRLTEVWMIIPLLPLLVLVGMFYSRSLWVMLLVIILKGLLSAQIKTYRSMFLQVKEEQFIEAAKAYGTSDKRIIFLYMIPKIIPTTIPNFVIGIPTYVFLEASLAMLGLGDPLLPTWGKILEDAWGQGALYMGQYYWAVQPAILLMITGLSFAMTGFALDRIFNPRLRRE